MFVVMVHQSFPHFAYVHEDILAQYSSYAGNATCQEGFDGSISSWELI